MLYSKNGETTLTHCLFTTRGRERKKKKKMFPSYIFGKEERRKQNRKIYLFFLCLNCKWK